MALTDHPFMGRFARTLPAAISVTLAMLGPVAAAQDSPPIRKRFSRAEVAEVYLGFERAMRDHPPGPGEAADINRAFDRATMQFFAGEGIMKILRQTGDRLRFGDAVTSNQKFASSLCITVRPRVLALSNPGPVVIGVEPMYGAQPVGAVAVRVIAPDGREVFRAATTEARAEFKIDPAKLSQGLCRVELVAGDDPQFRAYCTISDRPLGTIREELSKALDEAPQGAPEQAVAACRARIRLLTDTPDMENSSQFLADPTALRSQIESEVAAIKLGKDPFRGRVGDYWRVFSYRGAEIPCRVVAPATVKPSEPRPLLIALHGAGGDENMFPDGYGDGALKKLAEKHGLIVLSPRTEMVIGNAPLFDSLVESAAELYPIDRSRIYLVGHSLGAIASTGLITQRSEAIAAAVLIGGMGRFAEGATISPALVITGELDPLMSAASVQAGVAKATAAGQPVELRLLAGRGHTLLVGEQLPEAIVWLLKHHK